MLMKSSTIGLVLSLALLAPWTAPSASAQDAASPTTATGKKRMRKAAKVSPAPKAPKAPKLGKKRPVKTPASPDAASATAKTKTKTKRLKKGAAVEPVVAEPVDVPAAVEPSPATVATPAPAEAEPTERTSSVVLSGDERPWARGVSQQRQQLAIDLFRTANTLLKESLFPKAAEQYRQALTHWDHPAIHYNLALALLNLDQPIEVHQHLEAAMRYGAAPLDTEKLENARAYKTLVEKQLARLEITCETPGASVVMDGRPLFVGPGRFEGWVRAGPHTLVATGEGYLTQDQSRTLSPGERTSLDLRLFTSDDLIQYRRKWSAWKPWAVVGTGVALAAGGVLLHSGARSDFEKFDTAIASCGGCVPEPAVADHRSRGDTLQTGAFAAYAVGGAAVVTGAVLVYLNRLQPIQVDPSEAAKAPKSTASVTPYLGAGGGGASATFRF
ncbi:peptidase associated/transthyretin-like domain-containing protein [Pyxidicoccus xibeiensis]|uniref:hypothetical protein n=1 Tax=Pyxidicoccus xibeiensis TaxID=2906759 RepID=UPI0020A82E94|nr:hypothetical protein [Pyxidicoccus xibeiensis]MCP3137972.1 hypothetical protein [Pyxidicoccus xibeiensis]